MSINPFAVVCDHVKSTDRYYLNMCYRNNLYLNISLFPSTCIYVTARQTIMEVQLETHYTTCKKPYYQ